MQEAKIFTDTIYGTKNLQNPLWLIRQSVKCLLSHAYVHACMATTHWTMSDVSTSTNCVCLSQNAVFFVYACV